MFDLMDGNLVSTPGQQLEFQELLDMLEIHAEFEPEEDVVKSILYALKFTMTGQQVDNCSWG